MNNKAIPFGALVLSAFLLLSASITSAATEDQPDENAIVKVKDAGSVTFLRDFNSQFRAALKQKQYGDGDIQCVGCDGLDEKKGEKPPTQLSYFFPGTKAAIAEVLIATWVTAPGREDASLTFMPPACSNYPQPCYSRPSCSGGTTPYCRKQPTGSCLTVPSCLP